MKQKSLRRIIPILLVMSILFTFVACEKATDTVEENTTVSETGNSIESSSTIAEEETFDQMAKYEPVVELTTVRSNNGMEKFLPGESIDNNAYYKLYEEELGIKVKNNWVVDGSQYELKANITIASNDLPDFFNVTNKQLDSLVKSDSIYDVSDVYDKYALPLTKEIVNQDGGIALGVSKFDGKLMAIPVTGSAYDLVPLIYVRSDWMEKLNISAPKSMDDIFKIAEAFTTKDPDGNNKNDTYGLAVSKNLFGDAPGLEGFFNSYHAYPTSWVKDTSGNLVYGSVLPESRTALQVLQEMYKSGQIHKEFGVKDDAKIVEELNAGKCGICYGVMYLPLLLQPGKVRDPKLDWQAYQLVSADDKPALAQLEMPVVQWTVVNKNCKNPEAVIKLLNVFVEKMWGETADAKLYGNGEGDAAITPFKCSPIMVWPALKNVNIYKKCADALTTNDTSKMNAEEKSDYDQIIKFNNGDNTFWGMTRVFGPGSSHEMINKYYLEGNQVIYDQFYGTPTATMAEKWATLLKLRNEAFTKIILGKPIEDFDEFVEQWKKLGGDTITQEVNDWYKSRQ